MKTKNNVQKTILRSFAVVVSFVLISFTVSAQDFWKKLLTNSSFNEIAIAMAETSKKPAESDNTKTTTAFIFNEETDKTLSMESWMTNENYFRTSYNLLRSYPENKNEIENWMLNENLFEVKGEVEDQLKLEDWMTSDKVWKI